MKDEPTISRIREVRHQISEECGHDPKKLVAYYMKRQRQAQEKKQYREAEPQQEA